MNYNNALPSRFERSRCPSRETPTQNGRPAQNARVVIELSDSDEDRMNIDMSEMSMGVGSAHAPPQGPDRLSGVEMNMDMEKMSMEAGKSHAPSQGPVKRKKQKTPSRCSYCYSNLHNEVRCPRRADNLSKKERKAVQIASHRANRAVRLTSEARGGAKKALQAATTLGGKNSQIPKGPKANRHLQQKRPACQSGAAKKKTSRQRRAANPPIAYTGPVHPNSSHYDQVRPGQPLGPEAAQLGGFAKSNAESNVILQREPIPAFSFVHTTTPTCPPSYYQDQAHPNRQPFVAAPPYEFTRLKTERNKIAQLQELVPSISFINARTALLMHNWDLSLAFEMAGIIEDKKAGAGKEGHGSKRVVQEWEAKFFDGQGAGEVRKPSFSGAGALPKATYEPLERNAMGLSKAEYPSQAGNIKPVVGNDMRASILDTHQYSGGQGEDMRSIASTGQHARDNEGATNPFPMAEGGYGTQEMLAHTSLPYHAETRFSSRTGPSYPAEWSFDQATNTTGAEGIDSILRRLMHK